MLGELIGDVAGSRYEFHPWRGRLEDMPLFTPRSRFTDDTVLTFAVADALMCLRGDEEEFRELLVDKFHEYGAKYPHAGYGRTFARWLRQREREPYNSFGNGSAMRVSPVGWAFDNLEDVEKFATASADVTHNHPEGIKGAQAVAGCVFLARQGSGKSEIRDYVTGRYDYDLNRTIAEIRENYSFDVTCQGSVPEAIIAFLEGDSVEETIRLAISLGGDADTQAAIAGSIAEPFYGGVPENLRVAALDSLDKFMFGKFRAWNRFLEERGIAG